MCGQKITFEVFCWNNYSESKFIQTDLLKLSLDNQFTGWQNIFPYIYFSTSQKSNIKMYFSNAIRFPNFFSEFSVRFFSRKRIQNFYFLKWFTFPKFLSRSAGCPITEFPKDRTSEAFHFSKKIFLSNQISRRHVFRARISNRVLLCIIIITMLLIFQKRKETISS